MTALAERLLKTIDDFDLPNPIQRTTYKIKGGVEGFSGRIRCFGAKNLTSKAMVASLLTRDTTVLCNVPPTGDVDITQALLEQVGAVVTHDQDHVMTIDPSSLHTFFLTTPDSGSNRVPILMLSALLHRSKDVFVPASGGDKIGARHVNFHVEAMRAFGAHVEISEDGYRAWRSERLKGCTLTLPYPSVGTTETCLFLAVLAEGKSLIKNIALEPEIIELMVMLRTMGAFIHLNADRSVLIEGVPTLQGTRFSIFGDRLEAASWATLACASNSSLVLEGIRFDTLGNFLSYFLKIGGGCEVLGPETIRFYRKTPKLRPLTFETDVYPGLSTDWQPAFGVLLTQADGISAIHETVYERRFGYLEHLGRFGAKTQLTRNCLGSLPCRFNGQNHHHSAMIFGPTPFVAPTDSLEIPDLRAGLAFFTAAVLAKGTTVLEGAETLERGYGNLHERLSQTGIEMERASLAA